MAHPARDRVTVDLRGLGERVRAQAAAQHLSAGAFVRRAILSRLDDGAPGIETRIPEPIDQVVEVTLRLSAAHALLLATRARRADVSHGAYVEGLIEGTPPAPRPPDHAQAIAALVGSTDQLAALSADINGLLRAVRSGTPTERLERYRANLMSLSDDVRRHLTLAGDLLRQIGPRWPARTGRLNGPRVARR